MIGNMMELPKDEDTPQKRVEKIFTNMDKVKISNYSDSQKTFVESWWSTDERGV